MTGTVPTQDNAQIRQLMDDKATAMRTRHAEAVLAQYSPEAGQFDLAPPLRKAGSQVQDVAGLKSWFSGFDGDIDYEVRDLSVTTGGELAYCHSLNALTATPHGAPGSFTMWFRSSASSRPTTGRPPPASQRAVDVGSSHGGTSPVADPAAAAQASAGRRAPAA